ncbi:hypothetical protein DS691_21010 [Salmonella enterica subsp. enterica serovar Bareilly]|uniref:Uncharacterized protein n=1 Tax=Enterobacter phage KKP_3711 TaxID=3109398 RepID=A0AAX4Q608_9CAUD|nr:hypothetical protein [Salmonella enterica]EBX7861911.1 hypothetical protein [Salmonella enterica subsp. enterica serovar Bareilly]
MAVVHLARPTKFSRKNMSAANIVCASYPGDEDAHKIIWGLVSRSSNDINLEALKQAVEHIIFKSRL